LEGKSGVMTKALHVWVRGRVQGVFFRDSTQRKAASLGLEGWVRNLRDGRVEALFVGDDEACRQALDFVAVGPPSAVVTGVEHKWEDVPDNTLSGFEIRF
jgi:acylphosphatase